MEQPLPSSSPAKKGSRFKRFLLWMGLFLLLILAAPIAFILLYRNEIKSRVVAELNSHLAVKVYIDPADIDVSIIKTFPLAGVSFNHVCVMGSLPQRENDTLLKAQSISLLFSLKDIWEKNYTIRQIQINKAYLALYVDEKGRNNYQCWKDSSQHTIDQNTGGKTRFSLNDITLKDFTYSYKNASSKVKASGSFEKIQLSGNFSDTEYELEIQAKGLVSSVSSRKKEFIRNKNIQLSLSAQVKNDTYTFSKARLSLNKLNLDATGKIRVLNDAMPATINFTGHNVDVQSVLSMLPQSFQDKINDYESKGQFSVQSTLNGNLYDYNNLDIYAGMSIIGASITYKPLHATLSEVNFRGELVKPKNNPEVLSLKNVYAKQGDNYIEGNLDCYNFSDPVLSFKARGQYNLKDFLTLIPIDTLASAEGGVNFDVEASSLHLSHLSAKKHEAGNMHGKLSINAMRIAFKGGRQLEVPQGEVEADNQTLLTRNLKIMHQSSSLEINGEATNLLNYLFKENQPLYITAQIKSPQVKLDEFLFSPASDNNTGKKQVVSLNPLISARVELQIGKVLFNRFSAQSLVGVLELKDKKLMARNISFEAFGGDLTLDALADARDSSHINISGNAGLVDVDIKQLFGQLNNFGQKTITDNNLEGRATAQIDFSAQWNEQLVCNLSSILASADVNITKGELVNYKELEALSKYIEMKELQRIKFQTLQTHVDIKNQVVSILQTKINNSALNMELWGTHTFSNQIDYHIKLLLSELLAKRPGKNKQLDEELLENESDPELKRCVFIHMTGSADNPVISYDRKAAKNKIKQDIKEEKNTLKRILNEEFGLFKKDSTIQKKKTKEESNNFKIEFNNTAPKKAPKQEEDDEDF